MSKKSKKGDAELKLFHFRKEALVLVCEWTDCGLTCRTMELFLAHVSTHAESPNNGSTCLWNDCGFHIKGKGPHELQLHINFHAFHTKIKCMGENVLARKGIGTCSLNRLRHNLVPELPDQLSCLWEECKSAWHNAALFYQHVTDHVCLSDRNVKCFWEGCEGQFTTGYKLRDHMRVHTQEKLIACPNCGSLFYNRTKFIDHIKRQTASEDKTFHCSHCSKNFSSERLLRDHMRNHLNQFKCTKCDMTCTSPSSLDIHVLYRHSTDRPFACDLCEYSAKTQSDMEKHMSTHLLEKQFCCTHDDCEYSSRHAKTLERHVRRTHKTDGAADPRYLCHLCEHTFARGASLTRHLFKMHRFRWPSGHSRFRYKRNSDGSHQLQTVRYESIPGDEESADMASDNSADDDELDDIREDERQSVGVVMHADINVLNFGAYASSQKLNADSATVLSNEPPVPMSPVEAAVPRAINDDADGSQKTILASITGPDGTSHELVRILVDDRVYNMYERRANKAPVSEVDEKPTTISELL